MSGVRQVLPLNMYDAFSPRALSLGSPPNAVARPGDNPRLSLFGKTNVGHLHLTNIVVPHETGRDTDGHACVRSWYARTNVPLDRAMVKDAWNAWAHVTQATLCVGTMPVHAVPLVDLLGRKEGQDSDLPFTKSGIDWTGELAGLLCASYHHDTPAGKEPWETSFGVGVPDSRRTRPLDEGCCGCEARATEAPAHDHPAPADVRGADR